MDGRAEQLWTDVLLPQKSILSHNIPAAVSHGNRDLDLILIVARSGRRQLHNREALFERISSEFNDKAIATVLFDSDIPFTLQCALWRRARVVLGIHGGNLGCAPFLSPGQALIEGSFECSQQSTAPMSMFGVAATSNGAMYRCALVDKCGDRGCMESGGSIDIAGTINTIKEIYEVEAVKELSTWK